MMLILLLGIGGRLVRDFDLTIINYFLMINIMICTEQYLRKIDGKLHRMKSEMIMRRWSRADGLDVMVILPHQKSVNLIKVGEVVSEIEGQSFTVRWDDGETQEIARDQPFWVNI